METADCPPGGGGNCGKPWGEIKEIRLRWSRVKHWGRAAHPKHLQHTGNAVYWEEAFVVSPTEMLF